MAIERNGRKRRRADFAPQRDEKWHPLLTRRLNNCGCRKYDRDEQGAHWRRTEHSVLGDVDFPDCGFSRNVIFLLDAKRTSRLTSFFARQIQAMRDTRANCELEKVGYVSAHDRSAGRTTPLVSYTGNIRMLSRHRNPS